MRKSLAYLSLVACFAMLAFVAYINYDAIVGAFGDGPPYYGRSTNMDKWESPVPTLIVLDVVALAVSLILLRWFRSAKNLPTSTSEVPETGPHGAVEAAMRE